MAENESDKNVIYFSIHLGINPASTRPFGNVYIRSSGDYFTFDGANAKQDGIEFGDRVKHALKHPDFEISNRVIEGRVVLKKEWYEKLPLDKMVFDFVTEGNGKLIQWNIQNNQTVPHHDKVANPVVEFRFADFNPYAFLARLSNLIKEQSPVNYAQLNLKALDTIPEIAKYSIRGNNKPSLG